MTRASISLSEPNDDWIRSQIESKEFASRSEVLNDLVRKERERSREREYMVAKLIAAEHSIEREGWVTETGEAVLAGFKEKARKLGKL